MVTAFHGTLNLDLSGRVLALKLVAFGFMIADHVDWFFYGGALGIQATAGRLVFPVFAAILGHNLAVMSADAFPRLTRRLVLGGLAACLPYAYLQGSWLPLNVLLTFVAAVGVVWLLRLRSSWTALALFLLSGLVVDYQWFGIAAVLAAWWQTSRGWHWQLLAASLLVMPFNLSAWSLLALPVAFVCCAADGPAPRLKWLFYIGYPAHLAAIAIIRHL